MHCKPNKLFTPLFLVFFAAIAYASDENQLLITAISGKEVCQSTVVKINGNSVNSELCVTQGNFSHDVYTLKIDGKILLKGIDDETSKGISVNFKERKIVLRCAPQNVFPKATPEETLAEVKKTMPNATIEKVTTIADLLGSGPSPMGMEIGRLCVVNYDSEKLMSAQILF